MAMQAQRRLSSALCSRTFSSLMGSTQTSSISTRNCTSPARVIQAQPPFLTVSKRHQSTYAPPNVRSFPQYSIFGGTTMLCMKVMLPVFRTKGDVIALDNTGKKGRLLLEFTPRDSVGGKFLWDDTIRFGLTAEEIGLLVNQLPHYKVEYCRVQSNQDPRVAPAANQPDKVLTVEPGELGAINFTIDFVKDGIGGQVPDGFSDGAKVPKAGPLQVEVQAGEFEVLTTLMKYSIPQLTGWSQLLDIAVKNSLAETVYGSSVTGNSTPRRRTVVAGGDEVPF